MCVILQKYKLASFGNLRVFFVTLNARHQTSFTLLILPCQAEMLDCSIFLFTILHIEVELGSNFFYYKPFWSLPARKS